MNEKKLIKKAIRGDGDSFALLIQEKNDMLYRIAFSYTKNQQNALDVVQDTIMKAFTSLKTLKQEEYFYTWLTRILINTAKNSIKKEYKYLPLDVEPQNNFPAINEDYLDLYMALERLEDSERELIQLKFFEDMTFSEISNVLDISENTIKSRYYKILPKLEKFLQEDA